MLGSVIIYIVKCFLENCLIFFKFVQCAQKLKIRIWANCTKKIAKKPLIYYLLQSMLQTPLQKIKGLFVLLANLKKLYIKTKKSNKKKELQFCFKCDILINKGAK